MLRSIDQKNLLLGSELMFLSTEKKIKLKNGLTIIPNQIILTGNSQIITKEDLHYNQVKTLYF